MKHTLLNYSEVIFAVRRAMVVEAERIAEQIAQEIINGDPTSKVRPVGILSGVVEGKDTPSEELEKIKPNTEYPTDPDLIAYVEKKGSYRREQA